MKKAFINSILILILSVFIHFLYQYLPNNITLIVSPINESIWEHMKLIYSSYIFLLILKVLFKNKKENALTYLLAALFNIIIFLIIYLPIYYIFGENLIVTMIIYFITIVISNIFKNYLDKKKIKPRVNKLAIIFIIIIYLLFMILSFHPINIDIFYDKPNNMFGLKKIYS